MLATIESIPPEAVEPAMRAIGVVRSLAEDPTALAMGALVAGMLLVAFGRRLLGIVAGITGALAGVVAGLLGAEAIGIETVAQVPTVIAFPVVGGLLGLLAGVLIVRVVSLIGATAVLGVSAAMAVALFVQPMPVEQPAETPAEAAAESDEDVEPVSASAEGGEKALAERVWTNAVARWEGWTPTERIRLLAASAAGLAAGLVLALVRPNAASSVSATALGSAMIVASVIALDRWPTPAPGTDPAAGIFFAWFGLIVFGVLAQFVLLGRPERTSPRSSSETG